jgi:DNA-binding transcriptional MerR regulator/energy-coupling factor transporter ATP-binding protein EcfA2
MGSSSGRDLFEGFNGREVNEVLRRCTNCGRFVLIGPPRSGKTFFKEKYLKGVTVDEHTLGVTTTARTEGEEAKGESGLREKVMGLLKRMVPIIGMFTDKVRVKDEELRRVLGDRAPKHVVEEARRVIGNSPHRAYYIEWECVEKPNECTSDPDAIRALKLIKEVFDDRKVRIRWFKAEYVPPGLVEEVIELVREKGEDDAKRVLEGWVDAYSKAVGTLRKVLGLKENMLDWDELSIGLLSKFINNYANHVISSLALTPLLGAASQALISMLTHMAFEKERMNYLQEIVELRESLEGLLVKGPDGRHDFYELGRLLVYRVAYAMGMSYDEAKEALMGITGLREKELERRVNEIVDKIEELEKKIKELEEKLKSFRQGVHASIITADGDEFAKGDIYPNVRVENGELRVRVEGKYHRIVRAGKFNELVNEVRNRLLNQGFVVVVGPKGIGKSTLAAAEIWELFLKGDIGLVARVDMLDSGNYSEFITFIENYGEEFGKYFGRLLILYDPVSTETYEREPSTQQGQGVLAGSSGGVKRVRHVKIPRNVEVTIASLIDASSKLDGLRPELSDLRPPILIVLPSDVYNALSEEIRNELKKYKLDVSQGLVNTEFLAELIREYTRTKNNPNGCALSDRELSELTGELVKFDSGHALIARLIGEELARSNCDLGKIRELISKAKGKAEAFIILHINGLFKVHENTDTAEALVEIFALRRPFINSVRPGDPILTPGIVGLIGEERGAKALYGAEGGELRGWLALRQHDLIEEAIEKLLKCIVSKGEECKELGDALEPWKTGGVIVTLREVSEKVSNADGAVYYLASNYGEKLTNALKIFSNECWKRAAFIIGHALAGFPIVPRPEDLRIDIVESVGDALKECDVDYYLLAGNEMSPLIIGIGLSYTLLLAWAFIDKYNEAVAEVNRILNIARGRGGIYEAEIFYGLGLASIIANAARLGNVVKPGDADIALYIVTFTIQRVVLPDLIKLVLGALEPLYGKTPHRYLGLLTVASNMENLDPITVRYIFGKLNEILDKYGDRVKEHAWSLVDTIEAYAVLLRTHIGHFSSEEVGNMVGRVVNLLNELGKFKSKLGVIAWAYALAPALMHKGVRRLMEKTLGIDVVGKANGILEELSRLRGLVQDLMRDEEFRSYAESRQFKADEEAVMISILEAASLLKDALAHHKLDNNELVEAKELFNEAAEEGREIDDYESYLVSRSWALRVEAIKGSLVGDELTKLVDGFRELYEEAFNKERFTPRAGYLSTASGRLGEYLVSLALTGNYEMINELLEEHLWVLNANMEVSVLTRLTLNALISPRGELSGELKSKLSVNLKELIDALRYQMLREYLPALRVALGIAKPEDGIKLCEEFNDEFCVDLVLAVKGKSNVVKQLRERVINAFNAFNNSLKGLGIDVESLINEFRELVNGLNGRSLVQLTAPSTSMAHLALMLHALINGNKELAKAHALYGALRVAEKLPTRLFLEAYRACCDLGSESFRLAIARLFFLHI